MFIKMKTIDAIKFILPMFFFGLIQCSDIFEKCENADKACLIRDTQKMLSVLVPGSSEYGTEVLDPMPMDYVEFNSSGLLFSLSDAVTQGTKDIIFDDVSWDFKKKEFKFKFHTDVLVTGHYTAKGQILTIPISGDGEIEIKLSNMVLDWIFYFDIVKKDNKDYVKITKYEFDYEVKDSAKYKFTNLFEGNKELSDATVNFANQNGKQLASLFGRPLINVFAKRIVKNFNKFFKYYPLDTFFLNYDDV